MKSKIHKMALQVDVVVKVDVENGAADFARVSSAVLLAEVRRNASLLFGATAPQIELLLADAATQKMRFVVRSVDIDALRAATAITMKCGDVRVSLSVMSTAKHFSSRRPH